MKEYFVTWTYNANYDTLVIEAESPLDAINKVLNSFSKDFAEKGKIYVFEKPPIVIYDGKEV